MNFYTEYKIIDNFFGYVVKYFQSNKTEKISLLKFKKEGKKKCLRTNILMNLWKEW